MLIILFSEKEFKEIDNSAERLIANGAVEASSAHPVSRLQPHGKHPSAKRVTYFSIYN